MKIATCDNRKSGCEASMRLLEARRAWVGIVRDAVSTFFAILASAAATDPAISKCILDLQEGFTNLKLLVCLFLSSWLDRFVDSLPGPYRQENVPNITKFEGHNRVLYDRWTG